MNKSFRISPSKVLSRALINTVYHLLVKNKKGREGMLKREIGGGGGLIYHLRENRGFTVVNDAQVIRRQIATNAAEISALGTRLRVFIKRVNF